MTDLVKACPHENQREVGDVPRAGNNGERVCYDEVICEDCGVVLKWTIRKEEDCEHPDHENH